LNQLTEEKKIKNIIIFLLAQNSFVLYFLLGIGLVCLVRSSKKKIKNEINYLFKRKRQQKLIENKIIIKRWTWLEQQQQQQQKVEL